MRHRIPVKTTAGTVLGRQDAGVSVFWNIPYAAAPVGPGRFAAPVAPAPWAGTRDAGAPGPTAPAALRAGFGPLDLSALLGSRWVTGEDYLSVNVWTPSPHRDRLPVMVYVHGGGFLNGSGRAALYDGTGFARGGVVLVTLNYRLGAAGWLDVPGAPANRGLLDVIAALRWVRENISGFGGDPGNVTVCGQSAGAMVVAALLAAPRAEGLFRRAISQSGSGLCGFAPVQAERVTRALAGTLGIDARADAFAGVPDERLVSAVAGLGPVDVAVDGHYDTSLGSSPFKPVLDGAVLPRQPVDAVAGGRGSGVDLLIGTNADEAALYVVPTGRAARITEAEVAAAAARRHPDPAALVAAQRARWPDASPGELLAHLVTDAFTEGSRRLADAHAARSTAGTYAYLFRWRSTAFGGSLGACHCAELPFVFDRTDAPGLRGPQALLGDGDLPSDLASHMHHAWTGFAATGDPGWAPYRPGEDRTVQVIDERWRPAQL
ncbi:carboxylesterase/lipase family protein [Streptomyces platensis]|uniref:carboxylesterase/lipase family protein n=1 Tax=Streptomyces platensis TaxID=58346 RepID=UPI001F1B7BAF|nr:carboxylesterase family protein [Streptomyces platensis]MCF3144002.1 carboxylesterase/lipase family protein [Streptomyces platensis]